MPPTHYGIGSSPIMATPLTHLKTLSGAVRKMNRSSHIPVTPQGIERNRPATVSRTHSLADIAGDRHGGCSSSTTTFATAEEGSLTFAAEKRLHAAQSSQLEAGDRDDRDLPWAAAGAAGQTFEANIGNLGSIQVILE
jgi:hypothetical protein